MIADNEDWRPKRQREAHDCQVSQEELPARSPKILPNGK